MARLARAIFLAFAQEFLEFKLSALEICPGQQQAFGSFDFSNIRYKPKVTRFGKQILGFPNNLTVDQYLHARAQFDAIGRNPAAKTAQVQKARAFLKDVKTGIIQSIRKADPSLSSNAAKKIANQQAKEIRRPLAGLHEPDNIAGGWTKAKPGRMGDASVNSAIGPAWNGKGRATDKVGDFTETRVKQMDAWAEAAKQNGLGGSKMNVQLYVNGGQ